MTDPMVLSEMPENLPLLDQRNHGGNAIEYSFRRVTTSGTEGGKYNNFGIYYFKYGSGIGSSHAVRK